LIELPALQGTVTEADHCTGTSPPLSGDEGFADQQHDLAALCE
jgi:hypothetical protein